MATAELKRFKPEPTHKESFWAELGIDEDGVARAEAVHKGFQPKVYMKILDKTQLTQSEFHRVTHIPVSTIKRRLKNQERFSTQESDAMYRLAQLMKLATELFGDERRGLEWIREPVYGLGHKRPIDMVSTSVDFEVVRDLIGRLEHGVFS